MGSYGPVPERKAPSTKRLLLSNLLGFIGCTSEIHVGWEGVIIHEWVGLTDACGALAFPRVQSIAPPPTTVLTRLARFKLAAKARLGSRGSRSRLPSQEYYSTLASGMRLDCPVCLPAFASFSPTTSTPSSSTQPPAFTAYLLLLYRYPSIPFASLSARIAKQAPGVLRVSRCSSSLWTTNSTAAPTMTSLPTTSSLSSRSKSRS